MSKTARRSTGREWCVHFSGLMQERCRAGIAYATVKDTSTRPYQLPCLQGDQPATSCPSCRYPTAAEIAEREAETTAALARIGKARGAIVAHTGGKRGVSGEIPCPCCGNGTLHFSVAGYNGHIHARCSTDGCASWIE